MPYQPVTSNETAIPRQIQQLNRTLDTSLAATSGQVNGTLRELRATIAALPVPDSVHAERVGQKIPAGGGAIISEDITVPPGKTQCHAIATASGFYIPNGEAMSDMLAFRISLGGASSRNLPRIPDNMSTFHIMGTFSRKWAVQPQTTILLRLNAVGASKKPSYGTDEWVALDVLMFFSS